MLFLRFGRYCAILLCELNKNSRCVPLQALCRSRNVKREAGADPARSRHCDKGAHGRGAFQHQPLKHCFGKAAAGADLSVRKPACCWYRSYLLRTTRNWSCRKAYESWVFLCCHSANRKAFFVCGKRPFSALFRGMQTVLQEQKRKGSPS